MARIEENFVVFAGGRCFRVKEDLAVLPPTMLFSATLDLLFGECVIIGMESVDEPRNEGMLFVLRQNFGRYLIILIERDCDSEEFDLYDLSLAIGIAEAEETGQTVTEFLENERSQSERNEH